MSFSRLSRTQYPGVSFWKRFPSTNGPASTTSIEQIRHELFRFSVVAGNRKCSSVWVTRGPRVALNFRGLYGVEDLDDLRFR